MLQLVWMQQKEKKNILILISIFALLLSLYIFLDNYGYQSYYLIADAFGIKVVIQTLILNVLISFVSALSISMTLINYRLNNVTNGGSIFASIGNLFSVIFTGCATCGLSLLGAIGLGLGLPAIAPGAVKYKFFALLIILLGFIILTYIISTSVCKIKKGG